MRMRWSDSSTCQQPDERVPVDHPGEPVIVDRATAVGAPGSGVGRLMAKSFDDLIGPRQQRGWDREAERLGGFPIYD